jgi:hypothetical protein
VARSPPAFRSPTPPHQSASFQRPPRRRARALPPQ